MYEFNINIHLNINFKLLKHLLSNYF